MSDRPARVTPQQEAAWRCPRCGSKRSVGYGMWPGSGPVKAQCVPCGKVSDWPKIEREEEAEMSDHLDRAAEVIAPVLLRDYGMEYDTSHMTADEFMNPARDAARALADAGMLVSPERDAEVRADERGRCSVVHATLTDEALVAELVRRGVLREVEAECDDEVEGVYCHSDLHWSLDRHEGKRRYVTAWEPDTRTPQQRSDDAVDELRRRLTGDA